jgi:mono/diheme cytochrome c family protein
MRVPWLAAALAAAAVAIGAAACGSEGHVAEGEGSPAQGKTLFAEKCGSCHALDDAGTQATIGPDLDEAFDGPRAQGFDESSIRDLVRGQISYPVEDPVTDNPGMPGIDTTLPECGQGVKPGTNGCVEDQNEAADSIAAYVASVAGTGKKAGPTTTAAGPADGKTIFGSTCGSCHTLADAGTSGTVGPNLDESKPSLELALDRVTNGKGGMPSFKGQLTEEQIRAVAEYVSSVAG